MNYRQQDSLIPVLSHRVPIFISPVHVTVRNYVAVIVYQRQSIFSGSTVIGVRGRVPCRMGMYRNGIVLLPRYGVLVSRRMRMSYLY